MVRKMQFEMIYIFLTQKTPMSFAIYLLFKKLLSKQGTEIMIWEADYYPQVYKDSLNFN